MWKLGALAAGAILGLGGVPVGAQEVHLSLVPDVVPWNEQIDARIEGVGCSGAFAPPAERLEPHGRVIDIDLLGCEAGSTVPFAVTARIGPFLPDFGPYRVRVRNGSPQALPTPPPPVLDEAELKVHDLLSVFFVPPGMATDAAPVAITAKVLMYRVCYWSEGPRVSGKVVELTYGEGCTDPLPPYYDDRIESIVWNLGMLAPGVYDVRLLTVDAEELHVVVARTTLVVHDADGCLPSPTVLCLGGGRFKVEAVWTDFAGGTGVGHARPLDGDGASGLLWFFAPDNVELTAKLLDGCSVNDHFWFFLASGSTVEYTVTVTDTVTGATRTYASASGHSAPLLSDTSAFSCSGS